MAGENRAEDIVRTFCAAWERRDLDAVLAMMAVDIDYQNVPAPAMIGRDAVRAFIAPIIASTSRIEFRMCHLAALDDNVVLTERLDRLHFGEKTVDIPLMGIFVVRDGLISEWRDYGDSAHVQAQFAALSADQ